MNKPLVLANTALSPWLSEGLAGLYEVRNIREASEEQLARASVLVSTGAVGVDNGTIDRLPALKLIAIHGVGYDKVDIAHTAARNITVSNTPDVLTEDVADMALALILATARNIVTNDRLLRAGQWQVPLGRRVAGSRFGIIGLGRIGHAIARRLEGFSGTIAYHNRHPVAGSPYRFHPDLIELARDSDILINVAAGGAQSRHLVSGAVLAALGPDGLFINIGRGSSVDEAALVDALRRGAIAGAGLDVFEDEPNVPAALIAMDRVVLQPHQASATSQTRMAMADLVLANIAAHFAGRPLPTPV